MVDDNVDSTKSLELLFKLHGHDVQVAYTGTEGLELVSKFQPEAVLLDLGLPTIDGFEVARRIREMPGAKAITLIAVSGYGSPEIRQRTIEAGFNAHFVKPVDFDQLLEAVAREKSSR